MSGVEYGFNVVCHSGYSSLDWTGVYFFTGPPPNEPRLYFPERQLISMVCYGGLPSQYTVARTDDQGHTTMGRWTLTMPPAPHPLSIEAEYLWTLLRQDLVGASMRWEDWETKKASVWVLTDQFTTWHKDVELRLGEWRD